MQLASPGKQKAAYVINMRAAEAIVSSAPNPMNIFPISDVWSQAEPPFETARDDAGGVAISAAAIARGAAGATLAGGELGCSARSRSFS